MAQPLNNKRKRAIATIRRYLGRYRSEIAVGAVCLVITNVLLQASPWIMKITIDGLREGMETSALARYAILLVAAALASGVFRFFMRRIIIGVSRKIELDMRGDFFAHLEAMTPSFYNRNRTGDLMALATNDLNAVRSFVGPAVMYSMNTVMVGSFALTLMILLSWKLTLVSLLPMALLSVGMYYSMKLIHRYFEGVQERFATLNSRAQENLSGIRVVKAYAREHNEIREFEGASDDYVTANMKLFKVQSLLSPLLTSVAGLGGLLVLAYGGRQVIDGSITLGTFVAFNGYLAILIWPTIALGWVMNMMERGLASMQRVNAVLEQEPDVRAPQQGPAIGAPAGDYSIEFDDVSFSYNGDPDKYVLRDLSFRVGSGETVAVVGPTGAGKTTIVSLILRLYDPQQGSIRVGGYPISEIPLTDLRARVGLIPQDVFLFSDTIADNVAFGVSDGDAEMLERVTKAAAVHEEVLRFPKQFETMIGERGINLSGGQKQRLSIARALAKEPPILILDDALSSVDTDTEERILRSLRGELRQRTAIIISHRISTVREADRIFVLDEGRIVEQGVHNELIQQSGVYASMNEKQQLMYNIERD